MDPRSWQGATTPAGSRPVKEVATQPPVVEAPDQRVGISESHHEEAAYPFLVDAFGPSRSEESRRCKLEEEVAEGGGIEHAGIEDDGEGSVHAALPRDVRSIEPELLIENCELIED